MRKARIVSVAAALLTLETGLAATGTAQGTIDRVYTYGDGRLLVLGFAFGSSTCSNNGGFYLLAAHPRFERILSLVLSAQARGATLSVTAQIDNCWYPRIDETSATFIYTVD